MRNTTKFISDWKLIIGIQFILTVFIAYLVKKINVLPFRYYILFATGLAFLLLVPSLLSIPSKASKKRLSIRCVLGKVLSIIISVSLVLGSVFMHYTTGFLKRITTTEEIITYSILVLDESDYHTLSDLNEKKIGLNPNMDSSIFSKINDAIKEEITYKKKKYYNTEDLSDSIFDQSVEAILINRAYYDIFEEYHNGFEDDTRVVWNFNISTEQEELVDNTEFDITKNSFTVCISGVDSRGSVKATSRSDVNMLVTVNPETHQVLLTSIPRDYYVELFSEKAKDKLTHSGLSGTVNTVKTLENLLDTDIDFYARVNFVALVKLVDALGGIDVYSDTDLTYRGINMKKGKNHIDGQTALAFSRERYAYSTGDRHRAQNQQDVLVAIIKKMMSPALLKNYTSILASIEDCFVTNISDSFISSLVSKQLSDRPSWKFKKYTLTGTGQTMRGGYYMPNSNLYYMIPNKKSIKKAKKKIKKVVEGEVDE